MRLQLEVRKGYVMSTSVAEGTSRRRHAAQADFQRPVLPRFHASHVKYQRVCTNTESCSIESSTARLLCRRCLARSCFASPDIFSQVIA